MPYPHNRTGLIEVLISGKIIENYQEHRRGACCLCCGVTVTGRYIHVVCTTSLPELVKITVYEPRQTQMDQPFREGVIIMSKCTLTECSGVYEKKNVAHVVRHKGKAVVLENVPVEICSVCGDVLLTLETAEAIEQLLKNPGRPAGEAPVYSMDRITA